MTGLKASTSAWKHMAKLWSWRYFGIRKKCDNQRDRLRQLEKSIVGVKKHNKELKAVIEAQEKELERYRNHPEIKREKLLLGVVITP